MKFKSILLSTSILSLVAASAHAAVTADITSADLIFSNGQFANAISGDGTAMVGSDDSFSAPFIYSNNNAVIGFAGYIGNGQVVSGRNSEWYGVSRDGSYYVGGYQDNSFTLQPFAYTYGAGSYTLLGTLTANGGAAYDVSDDKTIIVGNNVDNSFRYQAVKWVNEGSPVQLDALSGDINSGAYAISGDGTIIVGYSSTMGSGKAVMWNNSTTPTQLASNYGSDDVAYAISRDGTVIGGKSSNGANYMAALWKDNGATYVEAGVLNAFDDAVVNGLSGDGRVAVGKNTGTSNVAFRYTDLTGMEDLNTVLSNAGVNMSGITLTTATGISDDGTYIAANTSTSAYLVLYDDGLGAPIGGVTTVESVRKSIQELANQQVSQLAQQQTTANVLLSNGGWATQDSYTYMGGAFGSAVGYFGGQVARGDNSIRGGVSFGHQDYGAVDQDNSITVAAAGRHLFSGGAVRPYAELGGWVTPDEDLTLSRHYANGGGTATGKGTTNAYSWAGYAQAGAIWQAAEKTQIRGFGELGQQVLSYDAYAEALTASNPFPASVASGDVRMNMARAGAVASQQFSLSNMPLTASASAAVAHAFNVDGDMNVTVGGVGSTQASANDSTWGEFGLQLGAQLSQQWTGTVGVIGTSGNDEMGNKLHGTVGLSYKF